MTARPRFFAKIAFAACLGSMAISANAFDLRGFRGVSWGDGVDALGTTVAASTEGDVTCYQRERENLLFGDSELTGVRYCFRNDRMVMVTLDAAVDQKALTAQFQRTYGRPTARTARAASWGGKSPAVRAEVVAQGDAARLTLYAGKIEAPVSQRIAAAY